MTRIAVIGGGISGLATAFAIEREAAGANLEVETLIIEKEQRLGGKIWSRQEEGYLCEWGPNGFLDNKPMTLELCAQLGIGQHLLRSDDNARKRFIYSNKRLNRLPENAMSFLQSPLISWPGKMRLAAELVIPRKTAGDDETLADFGRRRLGAEALDKLISPMVSGIFAGNPEEMSLKSCFPRIYELEQEYGGLIRAMLKLAKKKRAEQQAGKVVASAAGPGGVLTSFSGGIQYLTDSVARQVKGQTLFGHGLRRLTPKKGGFLLELEDGSSHEAEFVITALPAYALADILAEQASQAAELLNEIPYAPMNVVCFGYEKTAVAHDLNGFGYLIPRAEGCSTLGTLWDSSIFSRRAPEGKVLLRSMMGGATNPQAITLSEGEVIAKTQHDLKQIMGIQCDPEFIRVFRHSQAIPQYTQGHATRVAGIMDNLSHLPDLLVTGNAFSGISLNDCINAANKMATRVIGRLRER